MDDNASHDSEIVQAEVVVEMPTGVPGVYQEIREVNPKRRWKLPLVLFVATCLSTWFVGIPMAGKYDGPWGLILNGLRYAIPVMTILICHEMGHFIQAWRYGVYASFPYFLPMPFSPLGTLGAVIAMEPRMGHRRALFDIGISGPLAGLVPTIIFLVVGLKRSTLGMPPVGDESVYGAPLLVQYLAEWILGPIPRGLVIHEHPMAFAGWVGLLVTSLNLMPIGQLDGGHVLYALLGRRANRVMSILLMLGVIVVAWNVKAYGSWMLMLFLLILMRPSHPPTADDEEPLGVFRTILGWLMLGFIIVGFTPTPIIQ
jgi:membrane-associated protease RseP (regulator of RpoE activity)